MGVRLLLCEECGCLSDEEARGWVAFLAEDPDGIESTSVATFCPRCAEEQFGYPVVRDDPDDRAGETP